MQEESAISVSPSFNSYSNTRLAAVAARVAGEFGSEDFRREFHVVDSGETGHADRAGGGDDDGFEFAFVRRDEELPSPVSADEIFQNGRIRPVYPVDLFPGSGSNSGSGKSPDAIRLPLRKLFIEERETAMTRTTSSSSSSEADELEGVPEDTYCVWRPSAAEERCDKSSSTGSNSKRWKFRDLLPRSHSDGGKDRFVFFTPTVSGRRKGTEEKVKLPPRAGKLKSAGGEKRRSYLPYRQDLVGLFSGVNGSNKNLQPF